MTNTNNSVQERTKGTCIAAFRRGNVVAAIMCRLSKRGRPYLAWYPLTVFSYKSTDNEEVSRFLFAEHGEDMSAVTALASEFLEKWKHNALGAIEQVKAEEAAQESAEKWRQELTSEREVMANDLRAIQDAASSSRMSKVVWGE